MRSRRYWPPQTTYAIIMKVNGRIQLYPVLRLAVFLVVGIIAGKALYGVVSAWIWYAALVVSLAVAVIIRRHSIAQTVLLFVIFIFLGGCLTAMKLSRVNVDLPDGDVVFEAVVVSSPVVTGKVVRCDMLISSMQRPMKVKASFYRDARADAIKPGCGIVAQAKFEKPRNFGRSNFDYAQYLLEHGFSATVFVYKDDWYSKAVSLKNLSYVERTMIVALKFRDTLLERLRTLGVDGQGYAVLAAMTLGERVSMSDKMTDEYSVSGAMHVLSLSGLHLGIIYAMLTMMFLWRRRSVLAQVLIVCAIWIYVFIAGLPVSAVRSAVMITVYSFVGLLNRDRMSLNVLAVAAVSMLIANPLNLYDIGFQMSFLSVMFILIFNRPAYNIMPERVRHICVLRWLWQMITVSFAAQLGVAPLVALYFGRFSCYFLLTNFVVIPVSTAILYGTVAVFITDWWPWLQACLCTALVEIVDFMNSSVSFVASLPGASIEGININAAQTLIIYVIIFSVYYLIKYLRRIVWIVR